MHRLFKEYKNIFYIPPESNVDPEIRKNFRWNFIVNGFDSATWVFGASFISISAVLPIYARHITDSAIVIGLIPALTDFLFYLPQIFLAPLVERLPRKYPLVLALGFIERLPYLILPFAVFWLNQLPRQAAVLTFILLMIWKSIGSGIVAIPWQEMIAKIIPVTHRGRYFGVSHLVGQFLGTGGAALAAVILASFPYPQNFAISFGVGAIGIWFSFFCLALTREPARPVAKTTHTKSQYTRRLQSILAQDDNFRTYLISRWLAYLGTMAFGFVAIFGVLRFGFQDSIAGIFTGILLAAGTIGYLAWGPFGDRVGHKRVMEITTLLWALAIVIILISDAFSIQWGLFVAFGLMGLSSSGSVLSDFNMTMEFGPETQRPTYIGLARAVTGPALLIAPLLGGWIAQSYGYQALFISALVFALSGLAVLGLFVKDPRFHPNIGEIM